MSDQSFQPGLRGAIILGPFVQIHKTTFQSPTQKSIMDPILKGSCILVLTVLIRLFYTPTFQATWTNRCAILDPLYSLRPLSMNAHTISSGLNALIPPSILSSPNSHVASSPKLFLIPQPELIRSLTLCLCVSCVQCQMYEMKGRSVLEISSLHY